MIVALLIYYITQKLLLISEIYKINQDSNQVSGNGVPVKKIFVKNNNIEFDKTTIQEFEKITMFEPLQNFLQENFDMPIDTIVSDLPEKKVASNSSKPYVTINGYIKTYKKKDITHGLITLGNKKGGAFAKLSIPDSKQEIIAEPTKIKLNKSDYIIHNSTLYQWYTQNDIILNDTLPAKLFEDIANLFFEFITSKNLEFPAGKTSFVLYIVPDSKITCIKTQQNSNISFVDALGNDSSFYPSKPSTNVTFFSYDDKAFTINCKEKEQFYESVGIGNQTLSKIILPQSKSTKILGLDWFFINMDSPKDSFEKTKNGIYAQLQKCYTKLKNDSGITKFHLLKVMCIKTSNAKREILINENLTMPKLEMLFFDISDIPPLALESLIVKRGKTTLFRYYIAAIKSVLEQTPFDRKLLVKLYTEQIHDNIRLWLDEKSDFKAKDFFKRSEFCRRNLKLPDSTDLLIMSDQEFAKSVGIMARSYIDFRKKKNLENNSFKTILQKNKYTIPDLQDVVKQIGRSLHLLKIDSASYDDIVGKISNTIKDSNSDTKDDLSYYFYLGYFGRQ